MESLHCFVGAQPSVLDQYLTCQWLWCAVMSVSVDFASAAKAQRAPSPKKLIRAQHERKEIRRAVLKAPSLKEGDWIGHAARGHLNHRQSLHVTTSVRLNDCPLSSVVERVTCNDEVGCSIQPVGIIFLPNNEREFGCFVRLICALNQLAYNLPNRASSDNLTPWSHHRSVRLDYTQIKLKL